MNTANPTRLIGLTLALLSGCSLHGLHPGAGSQCGIAKAHPSARQGYAGNVCLIAAWGQPAGPFHPALIA